MTAAYVISDVEPRDAAAFEVYRERAAAAIANHGGRYVARGGAFEVLEGEWTPRVMVMAEFPDMETARTWYRSPDCAKARHGSPDLTLGRGHPRFGPSR